MKTIQIELLGVVPSKKNMLRVSKIKRQGQRGVHLDPRTKKMINNLTVQVPGQYRGLGFIDPTITIEFISSNNRQDRDGKLITIFDILQNTQVIVNDNIKFFNGPIHIQPAQLCSVGEDKTIITLEPASITGMVQTRVTLSNDRWP